MVKGLERFREHFKGHEASYALIGGAACDILFGEADLPSKVPLEHRARHRTALAFHVLAE